VTVDREGNVFLTGEITGDATFGGITVKSAGGMDFVLAKLDAAGKLLWVRHGGGSLVDRGYGVVTDAQGNCYVTGHCESTDAEFDGVKLENAGGYDAFVAKYDRDGKLVWIHSMGGKGYDYGHGVAVDGNGDLVVVGAVAGSAVFGDTVLESELAGEGHVVSIDTRKAAVMREAVAAGAVIVNDVSALTHDRDSLAALRDLDVPVFVMHSQGDPTVMQVAPRYEDVALDVFDALAERIAACEAAGISRGRILADPGLGFGKTVAHNWALLGNLALLHGLGVALVVGASRKSFIGKATGEKVAGKRVFGSIGAGIAIVMQGVQVVRVHDVAETRQAIAVWRAAMDG
jgi:dihydropteroate synthase